MKHGYRELAISATWNPFWAMRDRNARNASHLARGSEVFLAAFEKCGAQMRRPHFSNASTLNVPSVLVVSYVLISLILWWKSGIPLQICCAQIDRFLALEPLRHLRYVVILVAGVITLLHIVYVQSLGAFRIKAVYAAQALDGYDVVAH